MNWRNAWNGRQQAASAERIERRDLLESGGRNRRNMTARADRSKPGAANQPTNAAGDMPAATARSASDVSSP
ncbi:hypothetical protein AQ805_29130 [Burkholderia pseudomallei]|nr:hypothetical protein AQ804_24385 [Burkholderia pseudomallei]OMW21639.1 hypothetical protein AQ805_29130 [Burkholderia pseudomallei]ONE98835.1 hypothetical protein AQ961_15805 [Burkholderia pseudomallei]